MASPGDVDDERKTATNILETLQLVYDFDIYRWEDTIPGYGRPVQQQIYEQIPISDCHVFVAILWRRLGTPTGMLRTDGSPYLSGTQYEIEQAIKAYELSGNGIPRIMLYRKMDDPTPTTNHDTDSYIQYGRLLEFLRLFEPGGKYPAWIFPFRGAEFESRFRTHIDRVLRDLLKATPTDQKTIQGESLSSESSQWTGTSTFLSTQQIEQGHRAFLASFARDELRQIVTIGLNIGYEEIVQSGTLAAEIFDLLMWTNRTGQISTLVLAARQANPGNPLLYSFAKQLGLAT